MGVCIALVFLFFISVVKILQWLALVGLVRRQSCQLRTQLKLIGLATYAAKVKIDSQKLLRLSALSRLNL